MEVRASSKLSRWSEASRAFSSSALDTYWLTCRDTCGSDSSTLVHVGVVHAPLPRLGSNGPAGSGSGSGTHLLPEGIFALPLRLVCGEPAGSFIRRILLVCEGPDRTRVLVLLQ